MSTATLNELKRALGERERLENAFKQNVINRINAILQGLRDCPAPPPGSPAAAALDLTRVQLDAFINELTHPTNLTDAEAQRIANTVDRNDLRRVGGPTRSLPARVPIAPGSTGSTGPTGPAAPASSWWSFGRAAPAPAPVAPRAVPRGSIYDDVDDEVAGPGWNPDWYRDPRESSSSRSSTPSWLDPRDSRSSRSLPPFAPRPAGPEWLNDPAFGGPPRGARGGWKSPRKRKPRGTKKI